MGYQIGNLGPGRAARAATTKKRQSKNIQTKDTQDAALKNLELIAIFTKNLKKLHLEQKIKFTFKFIYFEKQKFKVKFKCVELGKVNENLSKNDDCI